MSHPLKIGLVQYDIAWEQPDSNFRKVEQLLGDDNSLDMLILPEMWSTGFSMRPESVAEQPEGPAFQWMKDYARYTETVVCGSLSVRDGSRFVNRFYAVMPDGGSVHYDKKHLFSFGREDQHYAPGSSRIVFQVKGWSIMPVICYDLRFPAWCRNTLDYDMMVVVANWPSARIHHWDALLKARSIENQCYVAAVNRVGTDGNQLVYNGHSSVYDMNGSILRLEADTEQVIRSTLSKVELDAFRNQFRFLQDRDTFHF